MQKHVIPLFLCLLCGATVSAQSLPVSAGGDATGTGGSVAWSVGQAFYTAPTSNTGTASQGVQQPYEIFVVSQTEELAGFLITAYPNPTLHHIVLQIDERLTTDTDWKLFDMQGRQMQAGTIEGRTTSIDVQSLPAGTYLITVVHGRNQSKQFTFIKQ